MLIKELKELLDNKLLADDVPIIINSGMADDVGYTIRLEQNPWGRWAVMIDVDE